jgi:hypothetical protein
VVEFPGGEIAQVLVDPVRGEGAGDAVVPPRLRAHVPLPGSGDVPVVDHLVVIEDHRAREGGEQPADVRVAPRLAVKARVLLEIGDVLAGWFAGGAACADERPRLRRHVVGIHLIAHHQEQRRPVLGFLAAQSLRERAERVHAEAELVLGSVERVRPFVRSGYATRAEHDLDGAIRVERPDSARRRRARRLRPSLRAVEGDRVLVAPPRLESGDRDERVVVAGDLERPRAMAEHLDLARAVGLYPHSGGILTDVADQRPKN